MISFFRKIRRWLLAENKFSRYLVYAIGEIVLVIIGILIALQINNANEIRKKEKTAIEIFKQIQQDIEVSVKEADRIIEFYRRKDSLINLILSEKVSEIDYKNNFYLTHVITNYNYFIIQDKGYKKLSQYIDYTPNGTDSLLTKLDNLYSFIKNKIDNYNKAISEIILDFSKLERENKEWIWKLEFSDGNLIDSTVINYFLYDPIYKNYVLDYHTLAIFNLIDNTLTFRTNAIAIYKEIDNLIIKNTNSESEFPPFYFNVDNYKNWLGKYKCKDGEEDVIIKITNEDGILYGEINDNPKVEILPLSDTKFYLNGYTAFFSFTKDENDSMTSLRLSIWNTNLVCEKIE